MSVAAVGHAVVARSLNSSDMQIITTGIRDYQDREKVANTHRELQRVTPSYFEGYYITSISPTEYAEWLKEQGREVCCYACGRPLPE